MKKILFALLSGLSVQLSAQTVAGVVANFKDKTPVEFAPVALLKLPDSSLVAAFTSEAGGKFRFENVKPGNYFLRSSFVGFAPAGVPVSVDKISVQSDTLYLKEVSKEIDEVVVLGDRIKGKELVDRTVYSIPAEVSKAAPNAYDLLKKIPAISVDYNDNVSLNGSSNFIIQVDGKQRDKEFLARLQPADIESIEVINNPSGKYEGNIDGVINVKLKREARYGYSGNVNVSARPSKQTSANIAGSLDYSMGKATAYISGYGFYNNLSTDFTGNSIINAKDSAINTTGTGTYKFLAGSLNTGIDYFYDKYQTFSFNVNYKPVGNISEMEQNSGILLSSYPKYTENFLSKDSSGSHEINSSFFYRRQFEKPIQELTTELSYYTFFSDGKNRLNKNTVLIPSTPFGNSIFRLENNDNDRSSINFKTDYVHPVNMDTKLEAGVQVYRQQMDFNAEYSYDILKNVYKYTEFRTAAYAGMSVNIDRLGIQGTLRVENSQVDINKDTTDKYFTFLPSANLMYKFNAKHNVKFTYNRRINRPNINQLNPFEKIGFSDDISSGNPVLKPEHRDRLQFTYTLNIKKSYVSPYVYYEMYSDKVDEFSFIGFSNRLGKETFVRQPGNLLSGSEKGVGLNAMILFVNINFRYFEGQFDEYKNSLKPIAARKYSSYSIGGWAFAPLPWKMNWFAFANYSGENATAQGTIQSPFFYGTGLRKDFGNHTVGMFYLLPGISRLTVHNSTRNTAEFYAKEKVTFDSSYFIQLQYTYKFNKGRAAKKVQRQTETESDSKKGGLGGPN